MAATSVATNIRLNADAEIDSVLIDASGLQSLQSQVEVVENNLSTPLTGSYSTPASLRIGNTVERVTPADKNYEITDTGGVRVGPVTLLGENVTPADFDSNRSGKNVIDLVHFGRMNVPHVSVNREGFLTSKNHINHVASFNNYGVSKLFKSYDNDTRKAIPFEDFPGILDPVSFVSAGNYILQYMIITDLTRNIDKFIDPDDLNGAIEVFEIRNRFANTSISDIMIRGFKGSMTNENFYSHGQGASPIETKFEIDQVSNSIFEDSQDVLYGGITFSPRQGYTTSGSFAQDSPVPDENRIMAPFVEASDDRKQEFSSRLRDFIGAEYSGDIASERQIPELGTRFRSSNAGFIGSPNYVIIAEDRFINSGTDSIAFIGMNKS